LAPAIRGWARSRSGIVEKAVAKRLVSRPPPGGIAARPKFSGEVDANLDHRRPGRVELGIEMFEPGPISLASTAAISSSLRSSVRTARRSRATAWFGSVGPAAARGRIGLLLGV
jgi:hypothetical protein